MDSSESKRLVYTVRECAEILGMTADAIYNAVHRGDIPYFRVGGKILIPMAWLNKMLGTGD